MLSKHVFATGSDYALKIIAKSDKHLLNEIAVCNQLIALFKHTHPSLLHKQQQALVKLLQLVSSPIV
jgi:hypothetical protein